VTAPRLVLLQTSPRVAPGLLTLEAWDLLRAGPVFCADPELPVVDAVRQAGVPVTVAASPDEAAAAAAAGGRAVWLGESAVDVSGAAVDVVTVAGSYDLPGSRLLDAVAVMDRLRSPGGCPWDAKQTHESLAPYLLEEAYEAYQALEDGDVGTDLREELGDVLLQVLFHARLAAERADTGWTIDDLAAGLVDKLVRRHPHVFGDVSVADADAVEANWDAIKAEEKQRTSVTDGVPLGQPALSLVAKLVGRAQKAGLPTALADTDQGASVEDLIGRALFGIAARAKADGVDPEAALRTTARAYLATLQAAEKS